MSERQGVLATVARDGRPRLSNVLYEPDADSHIVRLDWKRRDWFLGIDQQHVFDRNGNIGPTLWWDGKIVGSWGITPVGELRLTVAADRGAAACAALEDAASRLHECLQGAVVTPRPTHPSSAHSLRG